MLLQSSDDRQAFIDDQFVDRDTVITRWHSEGTHTGTMFGVPATGRRMLIGGISICRIVTVGISLTGALSPSRFRSEPTL
jgi:predicted ester cyclase